MPSYDTALVTPTISELVGDLANQFNGPLAQVQASISLARELLPGLSHSAMSTGKFSEIFSLMSDVDALLDDSLHGVEEMTGLLATLKRCGRVAQVECMDFPVHESIDCAWVLSRHFFGKGIKLVKHYAVTPPVRCSPFQLNQALVNIFAGVAAALGAQSLQGCLTLRSVVHGPGTVRVDMLADRPGVSGASHPVMSRGRELLRDMGGNLEWRALPDGVTVCSVLLPTSDMRQAPLA